MLNIVDFLPLRMVTLSLPNYTDQALRIRYFNWKGGCDSVTLFCACVLLCNCMFNVCAHVARLLHKQYSNQNKQKSTHSSVMLINKCYVQKSSRVFAELCTSPVDVVMQFWRRCVALNTHQSNNSGCISAMCVCREISLSYDSNTHTDRSALNNDTRDSRRKTELNAAPANCELIAVDRAVSCDCSGVLDVPSPPALGRYFSHLADQQCCVQHINSSIIKRTGKKKIQSIFSRHGAEQQVRAIGLRYVALNCGAFCLSAESAVSSA